VNALGEPAAAATWTEWQVCVYEIQYRERRGRYDESGRDTRGRQRFLVARPETVDPAEPAFDPREGDDLVRAGVTWRVGTVKRQQVDQVSYWEVEGERL
jgi:hypothetical protein